MSALVRFGVSIEEELLTRFDKQIEEKGYTNRSEAIRDLARSGLREGDLLVGFKNQVVGGIDELQRLLVGAEIGVTSRLNLVRHQYQTTLEITPREAP